ncbi:MULTISPECIES: cation:proton antiporter [unclassified Achromobacter]|uniref:cation:proton antiporter n=1 Tax=unclassified Achromobacter TaxID=2626865 RepID=UPI000B518396|nr:MULTISPECIES: cation:proton antiporter [unclassified Achromobacter]OWT74448.1 sodium:proton exchanger [Achromobacter sp. HZ34]OWT78915.1 sodium:proton exchanger [Achromobacter sp. HZ28]
MDVGILVFGLATLLTLVCFMPPLAGRLKLPYSVLLAIVGCLLGLGVHIHGWAPPVVADMLDSIEKFEISSETFLTVFLPVLLFETALSMNVRRLLDDIGPILMMAIVAVLVCTVVVGYTLHMLSPYGLVVCLLLGAIVATTDPAAVVSIFRDLGAPKRLTTLVEGESLFNDAASISLYSVLLAVITGQSKLSVGNVFTDFVIHFIGGGLAGYVMGRLACYLFAWLRGFPAAEITLTLTLAYLTFYVSEHYLGVSGVVGTVIAGLVVGSTGRTRMAPTTFEYLTSAWAQFGFWANSLIFLFAAMLIPRIMEHATGADLWLILVLFVATLVARAIVVFGMLPLLKLTRLRARVSRAYKTVMLWGGLRGAVSLALALAVTERNDVPETARQFVAVATTGFVLMTLFINGISLRPLMRLLRLNELSQMERTIRNQAVMVALEDLQDKTDDVASADHIGPEVRERIRTVFDTSLQEVRDAEVSSMSLDARVSVGLAILARREEEMFFDVLKAQIVDWRLAESLLARSERLEDAVRAGGLGGFENGIAADVRYSKGFRVALRMHYLFGWQRWLASELGQRFAALMCKRTVAQRLIAFAGQQIKPMLGEETAEVLVRAHQRRLDAIENALQALNLQYPSYALWLQESYLGRVARQLERMRYREMLGQSLISGEVYADLVEKLEARWGHIDRHPPLDIEMSATELVKRVPLFESLSADSLRAICKLLKPRLALPDQVVLGHGRNVDAMCFVASGAVTVHLPDHTTVELGSGEFFGELALLGEQVMMPEVTSLGYSKLLMMSARDFRALLAGDPSLREGIEIVARQRMRAIEVWRQFSSTGTTTPASSPAPGQPQS